MGCVGKAEVVTYKINGELYIEGVGRFWERVAKTNDVKTYGVSEYLDVDDVEIYDLSSNGFVKVNRLVKNPDKGDWTRVTFENGRSLYLTEDHALPFGQASNARSPKRIDTSCASSFHQNRRIQFRFP